MEVKLRTPTEFLKSMEYNAAYAMLTCHANTEKLENEEPKTFIKKAVKMGHESILEHITLTYEINNLSRACLQELARHRHISLSVESTRHTLKKILNENIDDGGAINEAFLERFNVFEKDFIHDLFSLFEEIPSISNDELKYFIPEF
ncbi:MAG: FAD-dependent thymidylate synthase [Synergistaceae bacterium]|nr:FAD-dependent thymidylate synthase [Synergistaceae bacterium]